MDKNIAIVVQGPITQMEYDFIRDAWGSHQLIISTWENCVAEFNPNDMVIYNRIPEWKGVQNLGMQKISTQSGLQQAQKMGYTHALKIRNDMYPTNSQALLDCMDWDKLNLLAWHNHRDGYITDYIIGGGINDINHLFNIDVNGSYAERVLTEKLYNSGLWNKTNYFLDKITKENDVNWNHKGEFKRLSVYHTMPQYTTKQPTQWT